MLVIRMARTGRNKYPTYRIVAAESARAATGRFVSILGNYNPHTKELSLKKDEIAKYIATGAQPSNTVIRLLQREKMELPTWVKLELKVDKKALKAKADAIEAAKAEKEAAAAAKEAAKAAKEEAKNANTETAEAREEAVAGNATPDSQVETVASESAAADKAEAGEAAAAEAALEA